MRGEDLTDNAATPPVYNKQAGATKYFGICTTRYVCKPFYQSLEVRFHVDSAGEEFT